MRKALTLLSLLSAACTPIRQATPEETAQYQRVEAVRVTRNTEAAKGCKFLGNVAPDPVDYAARANQRALAGGTDMNREAQRQADAQADAKSALYGMKFKTEKLGGNLLFVVTEFPAATGEAYSCPAP